MTLSIAWTRTVGTSAELLFASDSRLRFGCAWDCCPKIFPMPRGDCALSFAGDTAQAYPLILQVARAITEHPKVLDRALDLCDLSGHVVKVCDGMRKLIHDLPSKETEPAAPEMMLVLGGYSWRLQDFRVWTIRFNAKSQRFERHRIPRLDGGSVLRFARPTVGSTRGRFLSVLRRRAAAIAHGRSRHRVAFAGDMCDVAQARVVELLIKREKWPNGDLDMEPFEVLRDMIREQLHSAIGGPPQVLKVYPHMNSILLGVDWPDRNSGAIAFAGRPLLQYEKTHNLILDPDLLETRAGHLR